MNIAKQGHTVISEDPNETILLVEDASGIARVVQKILNRKGFSVHITASGKETLDWLAHREPLFMLLDFKLPDMTGLDLITHLQDSGRDIAFIIITGHGDERTAVQMMKLGAIDYLVKDEAFLELLPAVVTGTYDKLKTKNRLQDAEKNLSESQEQLRKLLSAIEQSPSLLVITDTKGRIEYVNPAFCDCTGYGQEDVIGKTPNLLSSKTHTKDFYRDLWETIQRGKEWRGEFCNRRKNGEHFWERAVISSVKDASGRITQYLKVAENITAHKEASERIKSLVYYDSLTGLPNQALFLDRLETALPQAQRRREKIAVAVMNLDYFQRINHAFGHSFGDKILKAIARRLAKVVRPEDTVARFWGDRFLFALPHIREEKELVSLAQTILEALTPAFSIDFRDIYVTASLGLALFPHDGTTADLLLKNAEAALGRSKGQGANRFYFCHPSLNERARESLMLQGDMRRSLQQNDFVLHYQPQFDATTKRLTGAEALVRWQHPVHGLLFPDRFIEMAEETDLICPLGEWIIDEACRQFKSWQELGLSDFKISVNLSARQFHGSEILDVIEQAKKTHGIDPTALTLEITESLIMVDTDQTHRILTRMKELGYQIALDDFGTGYSSLKYLQKFPFDIIKIDKSFVMDCEKNPHNAAICRTIIGMAHSLGMEVTAEGVEKLEHESFLHGCGCNQVQGYYFSRPLEVKDFEEKWLFPASG